MSLAARIREALATWTGSDSELAKVLGCERTRISSERFRSYVVRERECKCRRVFKLARGEKFRLCEDCRGVDRRTWADRVASGNVQAVGTQRCGHCGAKGHNRRTCGRSEAQAAPEVKAT